MRRVLLRLWQAPQTAVGLLIVKVLRGAKRQTAGVSYYDAPLSGAVSLGEYIIVDRRLYKDDDTIRHEHGHQIQSQRWGWLYLLVVGLPSVIRVIYDRTAHASWTAEERSAWYYGGWPEKQADILGGVTSRKH